MEFTDLRGFSDPVCTPVYLGNTAEKLSASLSGVQGALGQVHTVRDHLPWPSWLPFLLAFSSGQFRQEWFPVSCVLTPSLRSPGHGAQTAALLPPRWDQLPSSSLGHLSPFFPCPSLALPGHPWPRLCRGGRRKSKLTPLTAPGEGLPGGLAGVFPKRVSRC